MSAPLWMGCATAWECDEMGHMNVRFYAAKAEAAVAGLLLDEGVPAGGIVSHHIRYHRECRAGTPLAVHGGALRRGDASQVYLSFASPGDDGPRATFVTTLAAGCALPPGPCMDVPAEGAPRGLVETVQRRSPGLAGAETAGFMEVTRTVIEPSHLDAEGALRPSAVIGLISDGVAHLMRRITPERGVEGARLGGAALEQRVIVLGAICVGAPVTIRSGVVEAGGKTLRFLHWILDRRTGAAIAMSEVVAVTFDLEARRAVALPPEALARIAGMKVRA